MRSWVTTGGHFDVAELGIFLPLPFLCGFFRQSALHSANNVLTDVRKELVSVAGVPSPHKDVLQVRTLVDQEIRVTGVSDPADFGVDEIVVSQVRCHKRQKLSDIADMVSGQSLRWMVHSVPWDSDGFQRVEAVLSFGVAIASCHTNLQELRIPVWWEKVAVAGTEKDWHRLVLVKLFVRQTNVGHKHTKRTCAVVQRHNEACGGTSSHNDLVGEEFGTRGRRHTSRRDIDGSSAGAKHELGTSILGFLVDSNHRLCRQSHAAIGVIYHIEPARKIRVLELGNQLAQMSSISHRSDAAAKSQRLQVLVTRALVLASHRPGVFGTQDDSARLDVCEGSVPSCLSCTTAKVPCVYYEPDRTNHAEKLHKIAELETLLKTVSEELNHMKAQFGQNHYETQPPSAAQFLYPVINLVKKPSKEKMFIGQGAVLSKVQAIRRIITVDQENTSIESALQQERAHQAEANDEAYVPTRASEDLFMRSYLSFHRHRYYFVEKDYVLKTFSKPPHTRDQWESFVVCIVLANGCRVSELARLSVQPSPRYYFDRAMNCLTQIQEMSQVQQIKACMLLALYLNYAYDYIDSFVMNAWELSGMAVRKLIQLGYHKKKQPTLENCVRAEYEKRLFWSVFAFDKLLCVSLGRPSSISDSDIDVPFPLSLEVLEDNPQEIYKLQMQQWMQSEFKMAPTSMTYVVESCRIRQIEGRINHLGYESTKSPDFQQQYDSINLSLEAWASNLPPRKAFNDSTNREVTFDYFTLAYHRAKLFLLLTRITKQEESLPSSSTLLYETLVAAGGICNSFKKIHRDSFLLYSFSERTREAESYRVLFETLIENILYNRDPQEVIATRDGQEKRGAFAFNSATTEMNDNILDDTKLFSFTFDDDFWKRLGID